MPLLRKLSLLFAAGCFGGLIKSVAVWQAGEQGITRAMGVHMAHGWTLAWLYPRLVLGGVWGLVFILPLFSNSLIKKGLILSLVPSLVQLVIIFPHYAHQGLMGLAAGQWTPVAVLVFNAIWGIATVVWLKGSGEK